MHTQTHTMLTHAPAQARKVHKEFVNSLHRCRHAFWKTVHANASLTYSWLRSYQDTDLFQLCMVGLQIRGKVDEVTAMRERLHKLWADRKNYYDQIFDLQIFLRDAEQLNTISGSQEVGDGGGIKWLWWLVVSLHVCVCMCVHSTWLCVGVCVYTRVHAHACVRVCVCKCVHGMWVYVCVHETETERQADRRACARVCLVMFFHSAFGSVIGSNIPLAQWPIIFHSKSIGHNI